MSLDLWLAAVAQPVGAWLRSLPGSLATASSDQSLWVAIGVALGFGSLALVIGVAALRRVKLIREQSPSSEILAIGLSFGLLLIAAVSAALRSVGQSGFTPVALAFIAALLIGDKGLHEPAEALKSPIDPSRHQARMPRLLPRVSVLGAAGAFVVAAALLYGTTIAPGPRDSSQHVEFRDEAYYAVLASDLNRSGVESIFSPSGFDQLQPLSRQTWYHWGELWLSADVIRLSALEPVPAHFYVTLPLLLLATASLAGTLVRRLANTDSPWAFASGFLGMLLLAPVPLFIVPFFAWWARGFVFGVTQYGLVALIVLVVTYFYSTAPVSRSPGASLLIAATMAAVVPAHIVTAILGATGAVAATLALVAQRFSSGLSPSVRFSSATGGGLAIGITTLVYGLATGHGLGATASSTSVMPFNETWIASLALTFLGSSVFVLIPAAWLLTRAEAGPRSWFFLVAMAAVGAGAVAWGLLLPDFNAFHFYFGAIAVFATPAALVATWTIREQLRRLHKSVAVAALGTVFVVQLVIGGATGIQRLVQFGPRPSDPIPRVVLDVVRQLPAGAKIAYQCQAFEEVAFWTPNLTSISAHTGRDMVPLCFQADFFSALVGGELSPDVPSPFFSSAPQRALFPNAHAHPSSAEVVAFLEQHGVQYIYADAQHPNTLVEHTTLLVSLGDVQLSAIR